MNAIDDFDNVVSMFMDDFGGDAVVRIKGASKKDPATGIIVQDVSEYPVRALLLEIEKLHSGLAQAQGSLLQIGDKICLIKPPEKDGQAYMLPVPDPTKDTVTMGGVEYKIVTTKKLDPAAISPIYYEFYLRK